MTNPSVSRPLERSRATALRILVRQSLARAGGMRAARITAALTTAGAIIMIAISAGSFGADATSLSIVATAAALITWLSGGFAALSLSTPPRDMAMVEGVTGLARARGFDARHFMRAIARESTRLILEVIVGPIVVIGAFVLSISKGGSLAMPLRSIGGAAVFGIFASILLAAVASTCRHWAGTRGRAWFMIVVFGPWILFEFMAPTGFGSFLTIPGFLASLWEALAATPS